MFIFYVLSWDIKRTHVSERDGPSASHTADPGSTPGNYKFINNKLVIVWNLAVRMCRVSNKSVSTMQMEHYLVPVTGHGHASFVLLIKACSYSVKAGERWITTLVSPYHKIEYLGVWYSDPHCG